MMALFTIAFFITIAGILLCLVLIGAVANEIMHYNKHTSKYDYFDDWEDRLP